MATRDPTALQAGQLARTGKLQAAHIGHIAEALSAVHAKAVAAQSDPSRAREALRQRLAEALERAAPILHESLATELQTRGTELHSKHSIPLGDRAAGDHPCAVAKHMQLDDVHFDESPARIVRATRAIGGTDACADLAALAVEIRDSGRGDLAEYLLSMYACESNDFDLYSVFPFYELVCTVERGCMVARTHGETEALKTLALGPSGPPPPYAPMLIALGGHIATGKSTLADALSPLVGAPVVNTDRTRKHLAGATPTTRLYKEPWTGAYSADFSRQVYAEVWRRANLVVASGRPAIVDASFRTVASRAKAIEIAASHDVPLHFVECVAPPHVCKERLEERAGRESVSDGRLEIFDELSSSFEVIDELPSELHMRVETTDSIEENVAEIVGALVTRS